jgi:hypothetical protein
MDAGQQDDLAGRGTGELPLDLLAPQQLRRRARTTAIGVLLVSAAIGGLIGLVGGRVAGLAAAAVVGLPLLVLIIAESRRRTTLHGSAITVRAVGSRMVDLRRMNRCQVLVNSVRGERTISLLVRGKNATVTVALARYAAAGGVELGIVALRALADRLAATGDVAALVISTLLVAQLRAEARGAGPAQRPLRRVAELVPPGRLARVVAADRLSAFVAELT